jgi:hypothetical protein
MFLPSSEPYLVVFAQDAGIGGEITQIYESGSQIQRAVMADPRGRR